MPLSLAGEASLRGSGGSVACCVYSRGMANAQEWEASRQRAEDAWEQIQQRFRQAHAEASDGNLDRESYQEARAEYDQAKLRYEQFVAAYEEAVSDDEPAPEPVREGMVASGGQAFDPLAPYTPDEQQGGSAHEDYDQDVDRTDVPAGATLARPEDEPSITSDQGDYEPSDEDYDASLQLGQSRSRLSTVVIAVVVVLILIAVVMIGRSAFSGSSGADKAKTSKPAKKPTPTRSAPSHSKLNASLIADLAKQSELREQPSAQAQAAAGYVFSASDDALVSVKDPLYANMSSASLRTEVVLATLASSKAASAALDSLVTRAKAPAAKLNGADGAADYRNGACPTTLVRKGSQLLQLTTRPTSGSCTKLVAGQLAQHERVRTQLADLLG